VSTAATAKTYSMSDLRNSKKTLFIKNLTPFLWTLHEGDVDIELKPVGAPDSIAYLPKEALDKAGVARNIAKGTIVVSPDLEDEMTELIQGRNTASQNLLNQFQIQVEDSPNARAIDAKDRMDSILAGSERKRVTAQGEQTTGSVLDDFINPKPFKTEDGRMYDPRTAEFIDEPLAEQLGDQDFGIKSVTVTRSTSLPATKEN
jgi:hypothetical protein